MAKAKKRVVPVHKIGRNWWLPVLSGIVSVAVGIIAIAYPDITLRVLGIIFGINILLVGGIALLMAFDTNSDTTHSVMRLIVGFIAVIAGLTYNFLPFMILPLYASLERLDLRLIEASKDLYANARTTFFKVTVPLTMPGIIAGILLTFIPAAGDYVNSTFLGGTQQAMIGNVIQSKYLVVNDYPVAAALSFTLLVIILVALLFYIKFAGTQALMGDDDEEEETA